MLAVRKVMRCGGVVAGKKVLCGVESECEMEMKRRKETRRDERKREIYAEKWKCVRCKS